MGSAERKESLRYLYQRVVDPLGGGTDGQLIFRSIARRLAEVAG